MAIISYLDANVLKLTNDFITGMFKAFICERCQLIEEWSHGGDGSRAVCVFEGSSPSAPAVAASLCDLTVTVTYALVVITEL